MEYAMTRRSAHNVLWNFNPSILCYDNRNFKTAHPDIQHNVCSESRSMDDPSVITDMLREKESLQDRAIEEVEITILLRACSKKKDLCRGNLVDDDIQRRGLLDKCLDALVTMYAKCGALSEAKKLFHMLKSRTVFTWTALISLYVDKGQCQDALSYFEQMQHEGTSPNAVTFVCILKACGKMGAADVGESIHDQIIKQGWLGNNVVLGNALATMYAKCAAMAKAWQVLEGLMVRDVTSWCILIIGFARLGQGEQALNCFDQMQDEGIVPNAVTYACILKACGSVGADDKGGQIYDQIVKQGLLRENLPLGSAVIDMYAKCGALAKARQVLEELPVRNVISWTSLIVGYVEHNECEEALSCFQQMQEEGLVSDTVTFIYALKACGVTGAAEQGTVIHDQVIHLGLLQNDLALGTALMDMYIKCGSLTKAREVLHGLPVRDAISWTLLIMGYAEHGEGQQALHCFEKMQSEGLCPNPSSFLLVLKSCAIVRVVDQGERIHRDVVKQGLLDVDMMLGSGLVSMYAMCGTPGKARRVLEELPVWDVVSWKGLIASYSELGHDAQALACYKQMQREGLTPDGVTYACILKACAHVGSISEGEKIHDEIKKKKLLVSDVVLGTALVDMYGKCGATAKARQVIEELPVRNLISWNALISGYVEQCQGVQAMICFEEMQQDGFSPNATTLSSILNACSRSGLVEDAHMFFVHMRLKYDLKPDSEHYTCMVDLLGRAGHLDKATGVIEKMNTSTTSAVWSALLSACWKLGDVDVARWAFEHALQVDQSSAMDYVLMADIYTDSGMEQDANKIEVMRIGNEEWKAKCRVRGSL